MLTAVLAWWADLAWPAVVAVMALAWLIAAAVEWFAWQPGVPRLVGTVEREPAVVPPPPHVDEPEPEVAYRPQPAAREPEPEPEPAYRPEPSSPVEEPEVEEPDPAPLPDEPAPPPQPPPDSTTQTPEGVEAEHAPPAEAETIAEPVDPDPAPDRTDVAAEPGPDPEPPAGDDGEVMDDEPRARRSWRDALRRRAADAGDPASERDRTHLRAVEAPPPEPVPAREPEPEPEPAATVVRMASRRPVEPRRWNVWQLESLARDQARVDPARAEEWRYLFVHLRQFADAEGSLPADFDGLVRESFGDLLEALDADRA